METIGRRAAAIAAVLTSLFVTTGCQVAGTKPVVQKAKAPTHRVAAHVVQKKVKAPIVVAY